MKKALLALFSLLLFSCSPKITTSFETTAKALTIEDKVAFLTFTMQSLKELKK